jgi:hypothetical protein
MALRYVWRMEWAEMFRQGIIDQSRIVNSNPSACPLRKGVSEKYRVGNRGMDRVSWVWRD